MNRRQFKFISFLLGTALLCIIAVQAIWVNTLISNSKKEFNRVFTEAMNNASSELQRLEELKLVGNKMNDLMGEAISKHHLNNVSVSTVTNKNEISLKARDTSFTIIKVDTNSSLPNKKITIKKVQNYGGGNYTDSVFTHVTISNTESKMKGRVKNIDSLIKQIMLDFEQKEISIADRTDTNQIRSVLKKELELKGLKTNFEFAVYDVNNQKLLSSPGFNENAGSLLTPLFMRDVFRKKSFLHAYPTQLNAYVWTNLKAALILTIIFTIFILIIFFITFRSILDQKKISEIKNDFINNMTHELKTPIATISLAIDAINNPLVKYDPPKLDSYTQILKEENKKLNDHVERVLQMALLDKGELLLDKKQTNVLALINSCVDNYKLQIQKKNAKVTVTGEETFLNADEFHLSNVFNNLLDNALKYSNNDCAINIVIEKKGGHTIIRFADNGIGIEAAVQKKIFDKFYRVEGGNLHGTKGFGLGLSYVRSIIEAHGGTIEVRSELNKGSEFIIKL